MTKNRPRNNRPLQSTTISHLSELYKLYTQRGTGKEVRRFVKFCLVGLSGVGVGVGSLWLLTEVAGLFYIISAVFAYILAVTNNFTWNHLWTFGDRQGDGHLPVIIKRWFKYLISTWAALGANLGILTLLTEVFGVYYIVSALCAIAVAAPVNFLASNFWVWRGGSPKK